MCLDGNDAVNNDEELARVMFSPSMLHGNEVSPSAFNMTHLPNGDETYVSVNRLKYGPVTKESVIKIKPRNQGDEVCGYAQINTGKIRSVKTDKITIDVKPRPSKYNKSHAGIFYTQDNKLIKGICESIDFLQVTTMLAKISKHIPF